MMVAGMRPRAGKAAYAARENLAGWLFALPAALGFLLFTLGPMIASLFYGFTDLTISGKWNLIGLENYARMFSGRDNYFYKALWVTTQYVLMSVPMKIVYAFLLAMALNQPVRGKSVFRTIFYLPTIVPTVAISMIWLWLLNPDFGLINQMLRSVGIKGLKWIYDKRSVIPSLSLMSMWTTGGITVVFLAGLQDVPKHLYEATSLDGGGAWARFRHVTLPMMSPTIFFNLCTTLIGSFQVFSEAYIMTNGGPDNASLFYVFYLYREAFSFTRMGSACAIAWVLFIIIMAVTMLVFKTSDRWVFYQAGEGGKAL
ncbi:MAG: sugar ABC transporter permease [Oscillospiraceae bacterium]|jgi:multiple sugar transport system permease protein|nr:sugar ABC transporter permease [Oscillospiraceae bacterium]